MIFLISLRHQTRALSDCKHEPEHVLLSHDRFFLQGMMSRQIKKVLVALTNGNITTTKVISRLDKIIATKSIEITKVESIWKHQSLFRAHINKTSLSFTYNSLVKWIQGTDNRCTRFMDMYETSRDYASPYECKSMGALDPISSKWERILKEHIISNIQTTASAQSRNNKIHNGLNQNNQVSSFPWRLCRFDVTNPDVLHQFHMTYISSTTFGILRSILQLKAKAYRSLTMVPYIRLAQPNETLPNKENRSTNILFIRDTDLHIFLFFGMRITK